MHPILAITPSRKEVSIILTVAILLIAGVIWGAVTIDAHNLAEKHKRMPRFVVTEMVQCKGTICNAVLEMDDITILVPYDSNDVHVGDTIYLSK